MDKLRLLRERYRMGSALVSHERRKKYCKPERITRLLEHMMKVDIAIQEEEEKGKMQEDVLLYAGSRRGRRSVPVSKLVAACVVLLLACLPVFYSFDTSPEPEWGVVSLSHLTDDARRMPQKTPGRMPGDTQKAPQTKTWIRVSGAGGKLFLEVLDIAKEKESFTVNN